ncbi:MAG: prohibitin family protein [Alphaproteobacteria bacterium]|nr:MAG: prohibitin family protein [Alphaproteobacteria bacterium]
MTENKKQDILLDLDAETVDDDEGAKKKKRGFLARNFSGFILTMLIVIMLGAVSYPLTVFTVPAGHVGVLFSRFDGGTVTNYIFNEGLHSKWPWNFVYVYDARLQVITERYDVLTRDGISIDVEMAYRFRIEKKLAPYLHQRVGKDYREIVLNSEIGSKLRAVLANYSLEDVYALNRTKLEQMVMEDASNDVERRKKVFKDLPEDPEYEEDLKLIHIDGIRIKSIKLPKRINDAIEEKLEQLQIAQEYSYRIQREKLEAERKRIEAQGIHDFQEIVNKGISDAFLRWKGIEATLELSKSENSKIIFFGAPKTGLPLILGDLESKANATPTTTMGGAGYDEYVTVKPDTGTKPKTGN